MVGARTRNGGLRATSKRPVDDEGLLDKGVGRFVQRCSTRLDRLDGTHRVDGVAGGDDVVVKGRHTDLHAAFLSDVDHVCGHAQLVRSERKDHLVDARIM